MWCETQCSLWAEPRLVLSAGTGCVGRQQLWIVLQASMKFSGRLFWYPRSATGRVGITQFLITPSCLFSIKKRFTPFWSIPFISLENPTRAEPNDSGEQTMNLWLCGNLSIYFSIIQFDFPIISEHLLKLQDMNHAFAKLNCACKHIYIVRLRLTYLKALERLGWI